jgi:chromosomal replication initiation ATPase DnaA
MDLGEKFNRNHANMIHAVRAVEDGRVYDVEVKAMLDGLETEFPWLRGEEVEVEA